MRLQVIIFFAKFQYLICNSSATSFQIRLGSHYLQTADSNRVIVSTPIYYVHDDYNPDTLEYDAGIIEFLLPVTLSGIVETR